VILIFKRKGDIKDNFYIKNTTAKVNNSWRPSTRRTLKYGNLNNLRIELARHVNRGNVNSGADQASLLRLSETLFLQSESGSRERGRGREK